MIKQQQLIVFAILSIGEIKAKYCYLCQAYIALLHCENKMISLKDKKKTHSTEDSCLTIVVYYNGHIHIA